MQDQGVVLASNQVQYSLLYRAPERNGVLKACQELGVTLIAYSPLCQGLLTGTICLMVCQGMHTHTNCCEKQACADYTASKRYCIV